MFYNEEKQQLPWKGDVLQAETWTGCSHNKERIKFTKTEVLYPGGTFLIIRNQPAIKNVQHLGTLVLGQQKKQSKIISSLYFI